MSNEDRSAHDVLQFLRTARRAGKGPDCPDEERLRLLAVGLAEQSESHALLAHVAACNCCGPLLRDAVQDLAEAPTDEEIEFATTSYLTNPRRRHALAKRLAGADARRFRFEWFRRPVARWMVPVGVVATAVVAGFFLQTQWLSGIAVAQRLTSRAYTANRTIATRFHGADYGHEGAARGDGTSSLSQPPELFDAEARVKRGIDAHPDDPGWLWLQGRIDLLVGKEDAAIAELLRAHALSAGDPHILSDLGTAYYEKAQKTEDPRLYVEAFEFFSKGLALKPNDPVLLFNKALAAEHIFSFNEARDAWEAYLHIEPHSGWAKEARKHLEEVKKNSTGSGPTRQPQPQKR